MYYRKWNIFRQKACPKNNYPKSNRRTMATTTILLPLFFEPLFFEQNIQSWLRLL
jgi:hypothetical protein